MKINRPLKSKKPFDEAKLVAKMEETLVNLIKKFTSEKCDKASKLINKTLLKAILYPEGFYYSLVSHLLGLNSNESRDIQSMRYDLKFSNEKYLEFSNYLRVVRNSLAHGITFGTEPFDRRMLIAFLKETLKIILELDSITSDSPEVRPLALAFESLLKKMLKPAESKRALEVSEIKILDAICEKAKTGHRLPSKFIRVLQSFTEVSLKTYSFRKWKETKLKPLNDFLLIVSGKPYIFVSWGTKTVNVWSGEGETTLDIDLSFTLKKLVPSLGNLVNIFGPDFLNNKMLTKLNGKQLLVRCYQNGRFITQKLGKCCFSKTNPNVQVYLVFRNVPPLEEYITTCLFQWRKTGDMNLLLGQKVKINGELVSITSVTTFGIKTETSTIKPKDMITVSNPYYSELQKFLGLPYLSDDYPDFTIESLNEVIGLDVMVGKEVFVSKDIKPFKCIFRKFNGTEILVVRDGRATSVDRDASFRLGDTSNPIPFSEWDRSVSLKDKLITVFPSMFQKVVINSFECVFIKFNGTRVIVNIDGRDVNINRNSYFSKGNGKPQRFSEWNRENKLIGERIRVFSTSNDSLFGRSTALDTEFIRIPKQIGLFTDVRETLDTYRYSNFNRTKPVTFQFWKDNFEFKKIELKIVSVHGKFYKVVALEDEAKLARFIGPWKELTFPLSTEFELFQPQSYPKSIRIHFETAT